MDDSLVPPHRRHPVVLVVIQSVAKGDQFQVTDLSVKRVVLEVHPEYFKVSHINTQAMILKYPQYTRRAMMV